MTRYDFYSTVEKPAKGQFQLRSRERRDLENLLTWVPLPGVELLDTPHGDCAARILLDSAQLAAAIRQIFTRRRTGAWTHGKGSGQMAGVRSAA